MGISETLIEKLRFEEKYKLNYPCDYTNSVFIEVMKEIFLYSNKIHIDILFRMIKELTEIDFNEILKEQSDEELALKILSECIMAVIIENMEILYNPQEDDILGALIIPICDILNLDIEDYGFSKIE
ncbi:MAG TPA: hypothetical protein VIK55_04845 [Paludibacter sp.]